MKNLFKSLMLVAVAAMALSACTEENNEVAAVAKKTIIEMTASLNADSRSGFMEKEDGSTTYKSEWHEGDKILVVENGNTDNYAIVDISKDGKFTAELEGDVTFIEVYSPAEVWTRKVDYVEATLPTVQTPTDYSVDPKAHILRSSPAAVSDGNVMMGHDFAYGKMTVVTPEEFVIDHVDVAFKGERFGYDFEHNLTLNATNVTDNVFMFSTYPMQVTEFTVTAYDTNGTTCTKSVDLIELETYFAFKYDTVVPFGVTLEADNNEDNEDNVNDDDYITLSSGKYIGDYYGYPLFQFSSSDNQNVLKVMLRTTNSSHNLIYDDTYSFTRSTQTFMSGSNYFMGGSYAGASTINGNTATNNIYDNSSFSVSSESGAGSVHTILFNIYDYNDNNYKFKFVGVIE